MLEGSPINVGQKKSGIDLGVSVAEVPVRLLARKHQNRRKMNLKRVLVSKEVKSSENILKNQSRKQSPIRQEKSSLKVRLA